MSIIDNIFNKYDADAILAQIATKMRELRINNNLTQKELAQKSGVTFSTLKRFEQVHEISLSNLVKIAVSLDATDSFFDLFAYEPPDSIDDILRKKQVTKRKRTRK